MATNEALNAATNGYANGRADTEPHPKEHEGFATSQPPVRIFLQPIAPPAALGLAGFAGSTFITAAWICAWYGNEHSPTVFFPFIGIFGGVAQFIAGLHGFRARDTLVTVINTMWGSFWIAVSILYAFVAAGVVPGHSIYTHFPDLAVWFVPLTLFTWSGAIAATARDLVLTACLFSLAIGCTIACGLFAYGEGVRSVIKAAAYFWMFSALCAWWRVTVYLIEEAFGPNHFITKFFPIVRTPIEKAGPNVSLGYGEPGVKRGVPRPEER